jgi:hypothetical protein
MKKLLMDMEKEKTEPLIITLEIGEVYKTNREKVMPGMYNRTRDLTLGKGSELKYIQKVESPLATRPDGTPFYYCLFVLKGADGFRKRIGLTGKDVLELLVPVPRLTSHASFRGHRI